MTAERPITRVAFTVHSFDADAFGHLGPGGAGRLPPGGGRPLRRRRSASAWPSWSARGATWVLARERVELDQPIRMGEVLEVETWPAGLDRLAALRDFRLWRDGVEVGRALTTWFAIDLATRKPLRPAELLPAALHAQPPHVLPLAEPPLPALEAAEVERRFQVRFSDIDVERARHQLQLRRLGARGHRRADLARSGGSRPSTCSSWPSAAATPTCAPARPRSRTAPASTRWRARPTARRWRGCAPAGWPARAECQGAHRPLPLGRAQRAPPPKKRPLRGPGARSPRTPTPENERWCYLQLAPTRTLGRRLQRFMAAAASW